MTEEMRKSWAMRRGQHVYFFSCSGFQPFLSIFIFSSLKHFHSHRCNLSIPHFCPLTYNNTYLSSNFEKILKFYCKITRMRNSNNIILYQKRNQKNIIDIIIIIIQQCSTHTRTHKHSYEWKFH